MDKTLGYECDISTLHEIAAFIGEMAWQRVSKREMFQKLSDIVSVLQIKTPSSRVLCVYLNSKSSDGKHILGARFVFNKNYQCKINPILHCNKIFNLVSDLKKEAIKLEREGK